MFDWLKGKAKDEPVLGLAGISLAVANVIVQIAKQRFGVDLSPNEVSLILTGIFTLAAILMRRKVTSDAKLDRLEESGAIAAHPDLGSVADAVRTPAKELPTAAATYSLDSDPLNRRA